MRVFAYAAAAKSDDVLEQTLVTRSKKSSLALSDHTFSDPFQRLEEAEQLPCVSCHLQQRRVQRIARAVNMH